MAMKGKQEWIIGQTVPKATCEKAQEMSTGFTSKRVVTAVSAAPRTPGSMWTSEGDNNVE